MSSQLDAQDQLDQDQSYAAVGVKRVVGTGDAHCNITMTSYTSYNNAGSLILLHLHHFATFNVKLNHSYFLNNTKIAAPLILEELLRL